MKPYTPAFEEPETVPVKKINLEKKNIYSHFGGRSQHKYEKYSKRNLQYFRKFYQCFPDVEIVNSCVHNLTWTHFRSLLRVSDEAARLWYMNEALYENWNVRTLDRNISTQYYQNLYMPA